MKTKSLLSWTRYIGVLLAVTAPALVIAQQLPGPFVAGGTLRAADLESLRSAVSALQSQRGIADCQWQPIVTTCPATALTCEALCPGARPFVIGGGCDGTSDAVVRESRPNPAENGWICEGRIPPMRAQALCCARF